MCGTFPRLPFILFFLPPRGPSGTAGQCGHGFSIVNERICRPCRGRLFHWRLFDGIFLWRRWFPFLWRWQRWFLFWDHWLSLTWGLDVGVLNFDTRRSTRWCSRFRHDVCDQLNKCCFFCCPVLVPILAVAVLVSILVVEQERLW